MHDATGGVIRMAGSLASEDEERHILLVDISRGYSKASPDLGSERPERPTLVRSHRESFETLNKDGLPSQETR